jgi:hypothetical protein
VVHGGRLRPLWLELFRWWADNGEQRRTCVLVLRSPRRWFVFQAEGLLQWRCEYNADEEVQLGVVVRHRLGLHVGEASPL